MWDVVNWGSCDVLLDCVGDYITMGLALFSISVKYERYLVLL